MHSFGRHIHRTAVKETKGRMLNQGWGYDLGTWLIDTFSFRGQVRQLRQRAAALASMEPGARVLDVGCGTETLAIDVERRVGAAGRVTGVDPAARQIARARSKAARRHAPIDSQVGVIEQLDFPDQSFDVVLSTLMMHHLPTSLKRQGFAEVARVLRPGGRLVIADFQHKRDRKGSAAHFHAGGSRMEDLTVLIKDAGFNHLATEEVTPLRFSSFPGASFLLAYKS